MPSPLPPKKSGFTLIELLTVIAIIGILAAITIPVVGKVRAAATKAACASNLRQCGQAMILYAGDNKQRLPDQQATEVTFALTSASPSWASSVMRYSDSKNRVQAGNALFCPGSRELGPDTTPICYAMNKNATGVQLSKFTRPGHTLLLRHTNRTNSSFTVVKDIFYGSGGLGYQDGSNSYNYLFADGHVASHTPLLDGDDWWMP